MTYAATTTTSVPFGAIVRRVQVSADSLTNAQRCQESMAQLRAWGWEGLDVRSIKRCAFAQVEVVFFASINPDGFDNYDETVVDYDAEERLAEGYVVNALDDDRCW